MLTISSLQNKRIVVLGLGLTGMSFVRFLTNNALDFVVNDSREQHGQFAELRQEHPEVQLFTGKWHADVIQSADLLLVSPGVDVTQSDIADNIRSDTEVWGDIELYARIKSTPTIAITGSNGKSTVVSMLQHVAQSLGINSQLGGNVGVPVLDTLCADAELLILELSSFQLETIYSLTPKVSCILNISDDHLDRHKTMEVYTALKQRIYQGAEFAIFNRDDKATVPSLATTELPTNSFGIKAESDNPNSLFITEFEGKNYLAKGSQLLVPISSLQVSGIHNAINALAVIAIGEVLAWPMEGMLSALQTFEGLPHRCQVIASEDGVCWINDSKATNVGATVAAIEGIAPTIASDKKLILIAGGDGKGADFSALKSIVDSNVNFTFALGKDKSEILRLSDRSQAVDTIEQAVALAKAKAQPGDVVLLSPACASIDMFANFMARGNAFVSAVQDIKEAS